MNNMKDAGEHALLDIVRVLQLGISLTVRCPINSLELLGDSMRGLGQRLSGLWNLGNSKLQDIVNKECLNVQYKFSSVFSGFI